MWMIENSEKLKNNKIVPKFIKKNQNEEYMTTQLIIQVIKCFALHTFFYIIFILLVIQKILQNYYITILHGIYI